MSDAATPGHTARGFVCAAVSIFGFRILAALTDDTAFGLVAILPIGMSQVCSCNWEDSVQPGAVVAAGDPMGYFLFGGSDVVMVFQRGVTLELVTTEHILMGEPYADVRPAEAQGGPNG